MKDADPFAIAFIVLVAPLAGAAEPCKALTKFSLPGHRLVIRQAQDCRPARLAYPRPYPRIAGWMA